MTAFLLNSHPEILSCGEMGPARSQRSPDLRCSCGRLLTSCPFLASVGAALSVAGVAFDPCDWGLRFRVSESGLLSKAAVAPLPRPMVPVRDRLFHLVPTFRRRIEVSGDRSMAFMRAALDLSGKSIFLDASKTPERVRLLQRPELDISMVHLVRDPYAFCESALKRCPPKRPVRQLARHWKRVNTAVEAAAVGLGEGRYVRLRFEDVVADPAAAFSHLSTFLGAGKADHPDSYEEGDHHILGNRVRLLGGARGSMAPLHQHVELSPSERGRVADIAGPLASSYGYET